VLITEVPILAREIAALGRSMYAGAPASYVIAGPIFRLAFHRRRVGFFDADVDELGTVFERRRHRLASMGAKS
jgi:hypothetical protein